MPIVQIHKLPIQDYRLSDRVTTEEWSRFIRDTNDCLETIEELHMQRSRTSLCCMLTGFASLGMATIFGGACYYCFKMNSYKAEERRLQSIFHQRLKDYNQMMFVARGIMINSIRTEENKYVYERLEVKIGPPMALAREMSLQFQSAGPTSPRQFAAMSGSNENDETVIGKIPTPTLGLPQVAHVLYDSEHVPYGQPVHVVHVQRTNYMVQDDGEPPPGGVSIMGQPKR